MTGPGPALDLAFRAERMITPSGPTGGWVGVRGGRIVSVAPLDKEPDVARVVRLAEDEVLLPGLVDTHVHINDPGRADWEGFDTATRAAAAGGVTTLVDMPLNSLPPTVDVAALAAKRAVAAGRVWVDVGFWGGAVPENIGTLGELHADGVFGFKCFLLPSGVDEFGYLDRPLLAKVMRELADLDALLIVHAEDPHVIAAAPEPVGRRYADFLASRPVAAERTAVDTVLELADGYGTRVHVLHLSDGSLIESIRDARRGGVRVSAETCPHYLSFCAEEIPDGATQFKCCPPIRAAANREPLWRGLADAVIDCVVSDHSPSTVELKRLDSGDFGLAWGGIAGLQVGLSAVWTQARQRGHGLAEVVRWMAAGPAELAGLRHKGRIEPGCDADFCVFAPDDTFLVDAARLRHRNPVSAYHGRPLAGMVRQTWLRGNEITGARPAGRLLARGRV